MARIPSTAPCGVMPLAAQPVFLAGTTTLAGIFFHGGKNSMGVQFCSMPLDQLADHQRIGKLQPFGKRQVADARLAVDAGVQVGKGKRGRSPDLGDGAHVQASFKALNAPLGEPCRATLAAGATTS